MALVRDWQLAEAALPAGWADARVQLTLEARRRRRAGDRAARAAPAAAHRARTRSRCGSSAAAPARAPPGSERALARLDAERLHGPLAVGVGRRAEPEAEQPAARRRRLCPTRGTQRWRRCRPTGATSSARSSSTPPTTSNRARCTSRRSTRAGSATRSDCSSAAPATSATAPRRAWSARCLERCDAAGMRGTRHRPARALRHPAGRDAGARLADRRPDGLAPPPASRRRAAPLPAQLGAEALGRAPRRCAPQARRVVLGERPLGRLVGDRERDRLAPGPDLVAAVDVEDPELAQLLAGGLARRGGELADRDLLGTATAMSWRIGRVGDDVG